MTTPLAERIRDRSYPVPSITLAAPAKINFLLDVIEKRPDGYHELRMIMQRVALYDRICLTTTATPGIQVICNSKWAPDGPKNIAWKAARSLFDHTGIDSGIKIEISKYIPVAAGLGGGSSDAASVLMGMNELLRLGLTAAELMDIGRTLGADVPFFIFKDPALAEGIGEKLTSLPSIPKCWILLVNPKVHVSTAWVYRSLQLTSRKELNKLPEFFDTVEQLAALLSNDLESVTIPAHPVIAAIKERLVRMGAVGSMMSGSGPTVFGIFKRFEEAEAARIEITRDNEWFAVTAETLYQHRYHWGVAKR